MSKNEEGRTMIEVLKDHLTEAESLIVVLGTAAESHRAGKDVPDAFWEEGIIKLGHRLSSLGAEAIAAALLLLPDEARDDVMNVILKTIKARLILNEANLAIHVAQRK